MAATLKKNTILLLVVVLLGVLTALYFFSGASQSTVNRSDRYFAVENPEDIYRIFLADKAGNKTLLERKEDYWLYNGQWKANPAAVKLLLEAITQVEMMYKPPRAALSNITKSLAVDGIKVEIYDRKNKLLKVYYIGGATNDESGVYGIMEGSEQPYVLYIPGWTGNIRFRYNLKGDDWRDRSVFAYDPDRIQSVSIEYPKQQSSSFILEKKGKQYTVRPFYDLTPPSKRPYKERSAETYLIGFERLGAEAFENRNPARDSISRQVPFAIIKVTDDSGQVREARFHPIFVEGMYQDPKTGTWHNQLPVERYYVDLVSTGDFMLVQDRVFNKIFWSYDFFFD